MRYLHLIDDTVFTNFAIASFEECNPGNNRVLIGVKNIDQPLRHTTLSDKIIVAQRRTKAFKAIVDRADFDVLVVHAMCIDKRWIVNRIKDASKKIVWLSWGTDIYNTPFYKKELYQPITRAAAIQQRKSIKGKAIAALRNLYYFSYTGMFPAAAYQKAVSRVNYCATVIPYEINILREFPFFKADQVLFSYESIQNLFRGREYEQEFTKGDAILIGNSVAPESNHLDVFEKIKQFEIGERELLVPLNYGEPADYKEVVLENGRKLFENNFHPLLEYYSSDAYLSLLKQCSTAIMNHNRQQGVGNLIALLWLGCKIFLSEKNPVFLYLKDKGFAVYSFQDELNNTSINLPLNNDEKERNRRLLMLEYDHEAVIKKTKSLLAVVEEGRVL
ncbi:TDP-N-acetylfucosamine:lipid II N-acetylfucosaminyltransferase [Chitinophaga sp. RAB17]|uniref:TDP-N-acetylfucosamine:lipid II N-acetylfucosaminyltransferase n=1 Tax=Chitinophaga sp. RAB17 TaxID=3233049 RepID=UPI003F91981C